MNNKSRFCLARLNKQRLKGGTKDAPNKIHKEEGERWTKKQNEILRNTRGKECTLVQVQIAKAFLLMLFNMMENKLFSYEIVEVPSSKVATRSLTAEELQEFDDSFKDIHDKVDRDKDFLDGKIDEHDEYYNEGDK